MERQGAHFETSAGEISVVEQGDKRAPSRAWRPQRNILLFQKLQNLGRMGFGVAHRNPVLFDRAIGTD
jgi:hypothetical protein